MSRPFCLARPVNDIYGVSLGFQKYPQWLMTLTGRRYHYGIDFKTPVGTRGFFAIAGTVFMVVSRPEFGNLVVVESHIESLNQKLYTYYAHLLEPAGCPVVGKQITTADSFGRTGNTGLTTGAGHLHFEARLGGYAQANAIDPRPYMKSRVAYGG